MDLVFKQRVLDAGLPSSVVLVGASNSQTDIAGCSASVIPTQHCRHAGWGYEIHKLLPKNSPVFALGRTGCSAECFVDCLSTHIGHLKIPPSLFVLDFAVTLRSESSLHQLIDRIAAFNASVLCMHFWHFCKHDFSCTHPNATSADLRAIDDPKEAYTMASRVCDERGIVSVSSRDLFLGEVSANRTRQAQLLRPRDYGFHASDAMSDRISRAIVLAATAARRPRAATDPHDVPWTRILSCYEWNGLDHLSKTRSLWHYRMFGPPQTLHNVGWAQQTLVRTTHDNRVKRDSRMMSVTYPNSYLFRVSVGSGHAGSRSRHAGGRHRRDVVRLAADLSYVMTFNATPVHIGCVEPCACGVVVDPRAKRNTVETVHRFFIDVNATEMECTLNASTPESGRFILVSLTILANYTNRTNDRTSLPFPNSRDTRPGI